MTALAASGAALALGTATGAAAAGGDDPRYRLANGCYALQSAVTGRFVVKDGDGGYVAAEDSSSAGERFRMQATALGRYLLFGAGEDFLAAEATATGARGVRTVPEPSPQADWEVRSGGDGFTLDLVGGEGRLATEPEGGRLVLEQPQAETGRQAFRFVPSTGCARYPEPEVNTEGTPARGATPYAEVTGLLDTHNHIMGFELAGGSLHCGRPWHAYGVAYALVDCPDHEPDGSGAVVENLLANGSPVGTHDTEGWPSFRGWPTYRTKTHEQAYYKWIERAWRGGLRVTVNLLFDQGTACKVYPLKRHRCDEWATILRQAHHTHALQDYIDAQSGGPGRGWFRIVRDPFEARRVINQGKLAVVLGIETSEPFNCGVYNEQPECSLEELDTRLQIAYDLGVRQMEIINKLDNAFGGVAMDGSPVESTLSNSGNRLETGRWFEVEHCKTEAHDREQPSVPGSGPESLQAAVIQLFAPPGVAPVYPEPPHCNARGLTSHGEHLLRQAMAKRMILDPDHLSVHARNQMLARLEAERYSGVISSHSWSTVDAYRRILRLGGMVTPISDPTEEFVREWRRVRARHDRRYRFGMGVGSDIHGFHRQPGPPDRPEQGITYPFKSIDGAVTLQRQRSGERVFDYNADGVAHYGLYPDWVEHLRRVGGRRLSDDLAGGAETYLQMWERAHGVPARRCVPRNARVTRDGIGPLKLGDGVRDTLYYAGQPLARPGRVWRWCVGRTRAGRQRTTVVFTRRARVGVVASTGRRHRVLGVRTGDRARRLPRRARRTPGGATIVTTRGGRGLVYGVAGGRVRWVAVASRSVQRSDRRLDRHLRQAGLLPVRTAPGG